MDYHNLFTEFNIRTALQACLSAKVRMQTEYCLSERMRLKSECGRHADLLKVRDEEIESLKAQLTVKEVEVTEVAHFRIRVSTVEAAEKDLELKDADVTVASFKSQNDSLVDQ
ncbi:hypothetical protein Tco_1365009, partial [Tanacetum coccineum]